MDTIFIGIISDKNVEISLKIILITYIIIILVFADLYVKSRLSIYFLCLRIEQRCCSGRWASWLLLMQRAHYIWIPWLVWRRLASFLRFHYMCIYTLSDLWKGDNYMYMHSGNWNTNTGLSSVWQKQFKRGGCLRLMRYTQFLKEEIDWKKCFSIGLQ